MTAVASLGPKYVTGKAFAVNTDQDIMFTSNIAHHERHVVLVVHKRTVKVQTKFAVLGRHGDFLFMDDEFLALAPVFDEVTDGAKFETEGIAKLEEVREARHGAVFMEDFANDANRIKPGHADKIHRSLGMAGTAKDAAFPGLEGKNVAGRNEVVRGGMRVGKDANRPGAVVGADAGGDTGSGINADHESGFEIVAILIDHAPDAKRSEAAFGGGNADETAPMFCHKVDGFRADFLGGHNEVAFVLSILIIGDNDHAALADVFKAIFDRVEIVQVVWSIAHGRGETNS